MRKPELLAPAGSKEAFYSAIHAGANAIFMAGYRFGARAYAENFAEEDLKESIRYAHLHGVSVFVVVNTLIFDDEVKDVLSYTDVLVKNHVDALIVQDIGLIKLLVTRYPNVHIHASTQVNAHHVSQVKLLKSLGVKRVILARETRLDVIKEIKKEVDIELEVFVHGALCVSYSGNCLMSSILNDRSGNRGACSYSCRLPYQLIEDDQVVSDESYLLSAKDLMTIEYIDQLIEAGIDSFKIEGRMRRNSYVAQTVMSYRKVIDAYFEHNSITLEPEIDRLKRVFNREYTKGFMLNEKPKDINNNFRPNHIGVKIGEVVGYEPNYALIKLTESLENGDGFRIIGDTEYGNLVTFMRRQNGKVIKKANAHDTILLKVKEKVLVGSIIYKTNDSVLEKNISLYLHDHTQVVPLKGYVKAFVGMPLEFEIIDEFDHHVQAVSDNNLELATNKPVTKEQIKKQFSKFGGTPYYMDQIEVYTKEQAFVNLSEINKLRREATEKLNEIRVQRDDAVIVKSKIESNFTYDENERLVVKVHTLEQLEVAINQGIKEIYYDDLLEGKVPKTSNIIFIPVRRRIIENLSYDIKGPTVVNELGSLYLNQGENDLIGDEFMNVTNIYSAALLSHYQVKRVTLSSELNKEHVINFSKRYQAVFNQIPNLEMIVYGHKDLMISKYCPVAKSFGHQPHCNLCFKHQYYLKHREHGTFALINDGQCNMRVMDSKAINLINEIELLRTANIKALRLDFTSEGSLETEKIIKDFQNAMRHEPYLVEMNQYRKGHFNH